MGANGISRLATKQLRQAAKLDLAANKNGMSYNLDYLPTYYEDNTVVDNENPDGLLQGRPWLERMNSVPGQDAAPAVAPGFDITNAELSQRGEDYTALQTRAMSFNSDGTKMIIGQVVSSPALTLREYTLSTPWDISTTSASLVQTQVIAQPVGTGACTWAHISRTGEHMYVFSGFNGSWHEYSFSTPFDVSTVSAIEDSYDPPESQNPEDGAVSEDGTKFFVLDINDRRVYQYTLDTPFSLSSVTYDNVSVDLTQFNSSSSARGLGFSTTGSRMYIADNVDQGNIYQFTLDTPWDISTATLDPGVFDTLSDLPEWEPTPNGIFETPDNFYFIGDGRDRVHRLIQSS